MGILKLIKGFSYMTVQSCGRIGMMRFGVGESGALDSTALAEGAYLVGNDIACGCLEFLSSGGVFEYIGDNTCFVVNGGDFACSLNGEDIVCGIAYGLASGDIIEVGSVRSGFVGYLHIGGGVMVDEVLGSHSTNLRAALGGFEGRLLAAGDELPIGAVAGVMRIGYGIDGGGSGGWGGEGLTEVRVLPGSGMGYYSSSMVERFFACEFIKGVGSDRLGSVLQYEGEPIFADKGGEGGEGIISDAIVLGDVQIQGDGTVVVLLADRQPTGGYPRIVTVIGVDIVGFVRLPIGAKFRFREVSYGEARELWLAELQRRERLGDYLYRLGDVGSDYLLARNLISGVTDGD